MASKGSKKTTSELFEVTLTNNEEISPGVHLIAFKREFDFLPGQVIKIAVDQVHPPRIYSICSGNREDEIRILFNIKEDGFLTPRLSGMIPGEKLWVSKPYGSFTGNDDPAWWIATGTGIAPFYSMCKSGKERNVTLIHGVSFTNQFYFEDELEQIFGENYVRCCSRESTCDVFPGRVSEYLNTLSVFPSAFTLPMYSTE